MVHIVIDNNIIDLLKKEHTAMSLYLYLLSLPEHWAFNKEHLKEALNIGHHKLEKSIRALRSHGLLEFIQTRNKSGRFTACAHKLYKDAR